MTKNLLILGARGGLGTTFFRYLKPFRHAFGTVIALDRTQSEDPIGEGVIAVALHLSPETMGEFAQLLSTHHIDIVLDLTDADTAMVAHAVFTTPYTSYVNTAFCTKESSSLSALSRFIDELPEITNRPHILFAGMNPGIISLMALSGAQLYGTPEEIVEFEYDSSRLRKDPDRPMVTWCRRQFLAEMLNDPAERMGDAERVIKEGRNALEACTPIDDYLRPFVRVQNVPAACLTPHEECVTLARRFQCPVKFLYAVHPVTMDWLHRQDKNTPRHDDELLLADNVRHPLTGAEHLGVCLSYGDHRFLAFNRVKNTEVKKTSATDYQVIVGVYAALHTLLTDALSNTIHFTDDLLHTSYAAFVTEHLHIETKWQERAGGRWRTVEAQDSVGISPFHGPRLQ